MVIVGSMVKIIKLVNKEIFIKKNERLSFDFTESKNNTLYKNESCEKIFPQLCFCFFEFYFINP